MSETKLGECGVRKCVFNEEDFHRCSWNCTRKYIDLDGNGKCTTSLLVDCATRGGHKFNYSNKNGSRICDMCDAVEIEEKVDYER